MVLSMARPWKHPKTGIYWLRRRVPDRLREVVGKLEIKKSLGTKDPAEAKRLHAAALLELDEAWASLTLGERSLSEREAWEVARSVYSDMMATFGENPSEQNHWDARVGPTVFHRDAVPFDPSDPWTIDPDACKRSRMEDWCTRKAQEVARVRGLLVDELGMQRLERAIAKACQAAAVELAQSARHGFVAAPVLAASAGVHATIDRQVVTLKSLLDGWAAEVKPVAKTLYAWGRTTEEFASFVGHNDAARMTFDDAVKWKNHLIEQGLAVRTIKYGKLAALRAIVQWGVDNRRLIDNFAAKVSVAGKVNVKERKRGFTDEEATTILKAADRETVSYLYWIPWLCAFTGARLSEVSQLRKEDVIEVEGISCVHFVPEAGSLKNAGSERAVPLHPALIERGFLRFVEKAKPGPLFKDLTPDRFGSRGGNGTKLIGRWVRGLGITDPRVSPSHAWRHRFKTLGRRFGMAEDISNAITGHGKRSVADSYGEYQMAALLRELDKLNSRRP